MERLVKKQSVKVLALILAAVALAPAVPAKAASVKGGFMGGCSGAADESYVQTSYKYEKWETQDGWWAGDLEWVVEEESKTKYNATQEEIKKEFIKAGIGEAESIEPLGDGEFNAAFKVRVKGTDYVLKIAPPKDATVVNHEHNMMHAEVFWYKQMSEKTSICVPKIYYEDFSQDTIKSDCFIMEMMYGEPLWKVNSDETLNASIQEKKIAMLMKFYYAFRQEKELLMKIE